MLYVFKLEALLNYRKRLEELAQQVLAQKIAALAEAQQQLDRLKMQERQCLFELMKRRTEGIPAAYYVLYTEYLDALARDIERQQMEVVQRNKAVTQARQKLIELSKQTKMIEKIKEKDLAAVRRETARLEQKESDDLAVMRRHRTTVLSEGRT